MKVLQVSNFFKPSFESGGVARSVYNISKGLSKRGHDVTVYTTNYSLRDVGVETNKPVNLEGMCVYYFENLRKYFPVKTPPVPYYLPLIIRKEIKNFDIIHIHEHRTLLAAIVSYYARKNRIPYIIQSRGSVLPFYQKESLKKFYDYLMGNKILENASAVIALTKVEAAQYKKMGINQDNIRVIPNFIDSCSCKNIEKGKFRSKYGISDNEQIILYLGRLDKIKGIDLLVEAFGDLAKNLSNVKLVIVGPDDGYLSSMNQQINQLGIQDKTIYTGPLYGSDKFEAYTDADVYVLPSRYETFPNTVLEAVVCETPVIVTERCGIADLVKDNMGLVIKWDKKSLKDGICSMITDEKMRNEFADKGKIFIRENLDSNIVAGKIENLYKSIIKN